MFNHIKVKSFSVLEIILVIALFSLMVLGISSTVIYVVKTSSQSTNSIKAALIAREGLEVYRDLVRDDITDLTNGNYGLTNSSGKWAVGGISDNASGFVRQIIVADDPINTSSPILSKKITSTVTYNNGTETYSLSTLLTNWRRYKAPPAQYWAFPSVNGSLDITLGTYTMTKFVKVGNYIYGIRAVANTNNLIVMDVTNPAAPAYVTQFSVNGTPSGIAYSGNYLYISTSDNTREITVVDITTRTSPTYYAYYDATGNTDTTGLSIVGNRLYLTRGGNAADPEFMILNITNPAAIVSVGVFQESGNSAINNCAIVGTYAYCGTAATTRAVTVLNITNEASPTQYTVLALANAVNWVEPLAAGYILTADAGNNLRSISTGATLTVLSTLAVGAAINQIDVNSGFTSAYLATALAANELYIVNISNLSSISAFGGYNETGTGTWNGVFYDSSSDLVYGTTILATKELSIMKPSYTNWIAPSLVATLDISGTATMIRMVKAGNYIYGVRSVAATNNVIVINISNPAAPTYIGAFSVNGTPTDITTDGSNIYISTTDTTRDISVMSLANPASPAYIGYYDATGSSTTTFIRLLGSRIFLGRVGSASTSEITILDYTTPSALVLKGVYETPSNITPYDIDRIGNYLLIANGSTTQELLVVNITNEVAPVLTGSLNLTGNTNYGYRIAAVGSTSALISDSVSAIYSVNLANMAVPAQLNTITTTSRINRIILTTDYTAALMATNNATYDFGVQNVANLSQLGALGGYGYTSTINDIIYDSSIDRIYAITNNVSGELIVLKPNY